ncbi:MAG: type II toxin-antitoxin system HicB family antitoxin [Nitrospirae bacterium]|nr:type II toxin-antitoxin system HicB family antitoxin [Nitrospirota bacterium]MBF0618123.1 type II toxin-antitoxin system HicB family antitoxin [Nitrospirota bacterium]
MSYKVSVLIEKDDSGYYAYCPALDGCQTQGDSFKEVLSNIKEAIALYIETLSEDERIVIPFHAGKTLHNKIAKTVINAV